MPDGLFSSAVARFSIQNLTRIGLIFNVGFGKEEVLSITSGFVSTIVVKIVLFVNKHFLTDSGHFSIVKQWNPNC